jgi:hypothetical protein
VDKTQTCWLWTGAVDKDGYGFITGPDGRKSSTHRLSFLIASGELPSGVVRHSCDVRTCVNPAHLLPGSQADNVADCVERGRVRYLHGEHCPWSKISTDQVMEMRALYATGALQKELAAQFGLAQSTVSMIVNHKSRTRG